MSGWVASMGAGGSQAGVHEQCQALCAPRGTGTLSSLQAPVLSCEHRDSSQHAHVHAQYGHTVSTCTFGFHSERTSVGSLSARFI